MLIGIDWGGTKIEGVAMERDGRELLRLREATPRHDYEGCLKAIRAMVDALEAKTGRKGQVGIGIPGSLEPKSRLGKGASSTWILGKPVEAETQRESSGILAAAVLTTFMLVFSIPFAIGMISERTTGITAGVVGVFQK